MLLNHFRVSASRNVLAKASTVGSPLFAVRSVVSKGPRYFPTVHGDHVKVEVGIVHFGVGRFHRAHQAVYIDEILQRGGHKWGICGVCILPEDEEVYKALKEQNGEYNVIERDSSTTVVRKIGSLVDILWGHAHPEDVLYTLTRKSVKIVTITVSEAGYFYHPDTRSLNFSHKDLQHDLELYRASVIHHCSPTAESDTPAALQPNPRTLFGYLSIGILYRYVNQVKKPFTVISCDNIESNGDLLRALLIEFCEQVKPDELEKPGKYNRYLKYLNHAVTFPNSMVDRITPAATAEELDYIRYPIKDYADFIPVGCEFHRQWVIEDNFCNIKPKFETLENVSLVSDIKPYEKIKIRCLNGGHMALGYAGHLAGFETIDETAGNEIFQQFLRNYFKEVSVTLDHNLDNMDVNEYQENLMERFTNYKIKDDLLRICKDGSSKIPGFVLPTIVEVLAGGTSSQCLSFVVASWIAFVEQKQMQGGSLDDVEEVALFALAEGMTTTAAVTVVGRERGTLLDTIADLDVKETTVTTVSKTADVALFLNEQRFFGDLGQNEIFVSQVQTMYLHIMSDGVMVAMEALLQTQNK